LTLFVNLKAFGEDVVIHKFLRISENALEMRPAFMTVREVLFEAERDQFATEGASGSGGWTPLKPATLEAKARRGEIMQTLQASRRLRDSLTGPGPNHIDIMTSDTYWFATLDDKAKFHQSKKPRKKNASGTDRLPRRPVVELNQQNRREIVSVVRKHIVDHGGM